jgi:hypothetical protein
MTIEIIYIANPSEANITKFSDLKYELRYTYLSITCFPYEINLPRGVYLFECYGASGDNTDHGGYTSEIIRINKLTTFYTYLGKKGTLNGVSTYNGGGKGTSSGYSGGGSTDIRLRGRHFRDFSSLKT